MSGVVVIGAGHAGSQLSVSLRAEGFAGAITLIDAEADLPYHKPPLSKTFLKSAEAEPQLLRAASAYDDAGVTRLQGWVSAIDPSARTLALGDRTLTYDELVLATGARNRALPELAGAANVHGLRSLGDARRLRAALAQAERLVVIGGGFIGLEIAAYLAGMGRRVTVLEAAPRALARVAAPETSERIAQTLAALGVDLRTQGFRRRGEVVTAVVRKEEIACDVVLVGIARRGGCAARARRRDRLQLGGVLTNARLQTSAPHVWAIGDVAETPHGQADGAPLRLESVQNATDQARHLAKGLTTGSVGEFRAVPWFWSDIGPLKMQIAGLALGADRRLARADAGRLAVFHFRAGRLTAVETLNSPADHMLARQLLDAGRTPPDPVLQEGAAATKAWATRA